MGVRRQAREAALQALFLCDFQENWNAETIKFYFEHFAVPKTVSPYASILCLGVLERLPEIDSKISLASENWSLRRMARVDRNVLRVATFEMIALNDIPTNVSIDEAIEVAKRYGADNSPVFVNGVLDRIASQLEASSEEAVTGAEMPIKEEETKAA